jgi:hypothetical protein
MFPLLRKVLVKRAAPVESGQEPLADPNRTTKRRGTRTVAKLPQARMPRSLPYTALRAEKPIASARLKGWTGYFHVLAFPSVAWWRERAGELCETRPRLDENRPKHLTHLPKRFLTTPPAGDTPWQTRDGGDVAFPSRLNLHRETVHERLLTLESRQGSSERKDALSCPPTQPLRMGFPDSERARGTERHGPRAKDEVKSASAGQMPRRLRRSLPGKPGFVTGTPARGPWGLASHADDVTRGRVGRAGMGPETGNRADDPAKE